MTHDNTAAVMEKFAAIRSNQGCVGNVHDASQLVFTLDHNVQDTSAPNLQKYEAIGHFC